MLITLWIIRITQEDFLRIHLSYDKIVLKYNFSIIYLSEKSYLLFVNKANQIIQIVIFCLSIISKKKSSDSTAGYPSRIENRKKTERLLAPLIQIPGC